MTSFRHLLLTRFNVRGFVAPPDDPPGWLEHRVGLFERICLPSVRGQTRAVDRWLVLFDEASPAALRERIGRWAESVPLVPCFVATHAGLDPVELVRAHGGLDRPYLVTTRLDNDDALARDHVAAVQERFAEQSCLFLNFDHGATLDAGRAYASRQPANPFASLIERADEARTVWCAEHNRLGDHGPVEHLGGAPMWLQAVHRHNVSNRRQDGRRLSPAAVRERFAVDPALLDAAGGALGRAAANAAFALRRSWARARGGRPAVRRAAVAAAAAGPPLPPPSLASPRLSVVLPTAGRARLLRRALDSLAAQTWRDFEVVVVDDASEDATPEVLAAAAREPGLPALVALRQPRRTGAAAARNRGVRAARADWVVFFDDDDELLPDALERLAGFLAAAPEDLAFTWGGVERVDALGRPAGRVEWPPAGAPPLAHLGAGTGYGLTVRRQALAAIGGFDESLAAGVDFDLLLRLGRRFRGRPLGGVVARVHLHRAPRLTDATAAKAESFERIAEKHRVFLARHPEVGLGFLLKAARQSYAAGRRRPGRRLLLSALRREPRRLGTWKTAACLELFGREELGLRRRLAALAPGGRRRRRAAAPPPPPAPAPARDDDAGGPFFSVVVPTHDRAALLPRAVASVLAQGFADFELIVVDDGSRDATGAVLAGLDDRRVVVVRRETAGGAAAARNLGIARAAGRWIAFLDDDDALRPGFLAAMHRALAAAPPDVGFAWCGIRRLCDEPGGGTTTLAEGAWQPRFADRRAAYLGFLRRRHVGTNCGLTVRRSLLAATGGFDEALACAEDTDLLIRLARHADFVAVPEALVDVHVHAGPRLTAYGGAMAAAYERILAKHAGALAAEPAIRAALEYKAGWLQYRAGDRRRARRHLARSLAARPWQLRGWSVLALFELCGRRAPAIHDRLSRRVRG